MKSKSKNSFFFRKILAKIHICHLFSVFPVIRIFLLICNDPVFSSLLDLTSCAILLLFSQLKWNLMWKINYFTRIVYRTLLKPSVPPDLQFLPPGHVRVTLSLSLSILYRFHFVIVFNVSITNYRSK